jgi:hypothetical protein
MQELIFKFETENLRLKWRTTLIELETAVRRYNLALKFRPDQLRVPAGNPDGGQWTLAAGSTPGRGHNQGPPLAQEDSQRRNSVILGEEEVRGGHAIRDHVGKSDEELMARVREDRGRAGIYSYARIRQGSFSSLESANDFVNRTLERNQADVNLVASGKAPNAFLTARFGYITGREAFRLGVYSSPYMRDTYGVGVFIVHDPSNARGFRVHTAYPRND